MWTLTYLQRLLETLQGMAAALQLPADPAWGDVLAHLPPTPTTILSGVPVLAPYGEGAQSLNKTTPRSYSGQSNYLHALWPGETLSPRTEKNATLVAAARNAFNHTAWGQDNSFSWVYAAAARSTWPLETTLATWRRELRASQKTNRLVAFGGLCSDSLGAIAYIHDMLVQSQEGFVRVFPAWPGNQSASFSGLRMRGGLLVGASFAGAPQWAGQPAGRTGGVTALSLAATAAGSVAFMSPWPGKGEGGVEVVLVGGGAISVEWAAVEGAEGGDVGTFLAQKGATYIVKESALARVGGT
jgi:hypothetical protein